MGKKISEMGLRIMKEFLRGKIGMNELEKPSEDGKNRSME